MWTSVMRMGRRSYRTIGAPSTAPAWDALAAPRRRDREGCAVATFRRRVPPFSPVARAQHRGAELAARAVHVDDTLPRYRRPAHGNPLYARAWRDGVGLDPAPG